MTVILWSSLGSAPNYKHVFNDVLELFIIFQTFDKLSPLFKKTLWQHLTPLTLSGGLPADLYLDKNTVTIMNGAQLTTLEVNTKVTFPFFKILKICADF